MSGRAGRSGGRHKPGALHVVGGTHRKDRHGDADEARAEVRDNRAERIPSPPALLKGAARAEWKRLAPMLHERGLLSARYRGTLAALCRAWGQMADAQRIIAREGLTTTTDKGNVIQHPAVGIANRAADQYRAYLIEFGLSPSAEGRLGRGDQPPADPVDEFEKERAKRRQAREAGGAPVAG